MFAGVFVILRSGDELCAHEFLVVPQLDGAGADGRIQAAARAGVPVTNYGMCISFTQGVLERVLSPFPEALAAFREAAGKREEK